MSPVAKILTLLLFFVGTVSVIIAVLHMQKLQSEKIILERELANSIVPQITYNGSAYSITGGAVSDVYNPQKEIPLATTVEILRIAYFSVWHRINPLFALEGVDPATLKQSIATLQDSTRTFSHFYSPEEKAIIEDYFYPISFLEHLPDLEAKRREVVITPSGINIAEYNNQLRAALLAYTEYIDTLKGLYEAFLTENGSRQANNIGGVTNNEQMISFLDSLGMLARKQMQEMGERERCLQELSPTCSPFPDISRVTEVPDTETHDSSQQFPDEVTTNERIISKAHMGKDGFVRPSNTPTVVLKNSSCFFKDPLTYYYISWEQRDGGSRALRATYINDLYFYDVDELNLNNPTPYFASIKERGVEYLYQSVSNIYMCPDESKDLAAIATLLEIQELLREMPLFAEGLETSISEEESRVPGKLEGEIVEAATVHETTVRMFIQHIRALLGTYSEVELTQMFGEEKTMYMRTLVQIANQNSSRLDELISEIVDMNTIVSTLHEYGNTITLNDLFTTRSYPIITLLVANKTVLPDDSLSFLSPPVMSEEELYSRMRLVSYNDVLRQTFTPEEAAHLIHYRKIP